jgi:endogenous inhibitor of DNA gyrase (YacG/DUF329 family)
VRPRAENSAYPFCSPPCKLVDLGRWLDGSYRIPGSLTGEVSDLESAAAEAPSNEPSPEVPEESE